MKVSFRIPLGPQQFIRSVLSLLTELLVGRADLMVFPLYLGYKSREIG